MYNERERTYQDGGRGVQGISTGIFLVRITYEYSGEVIENK